MKKIALSHKKELAYFDIGSGEHVIVCLSGLGCDHYNFSWLKDDLSKKFRLIIIDNRGMGESEDWQESYEIRDLASDTMELVDSLGIDKFGVIGISMGGFVTQELLQLAPDRINALALLCTTSGGDEYHALPFLSDESFIKVDEMGAAGVELAIRATVDQQLPEQNPDLFRKILALRSEHPYRVDQVLLQNHAAASFLSHKLTFEHVSAPALILHGENDRFVKPENSKILATKFKAATLSFISGADHLFFLEKSNEVAARLNSFFSKQWEII